MGSDDPVTLRVLIVEDSEDDALLLLRELQRGGYVPDMQRVDTACAMEVALREQSWDLIIADHNMPGFDSRQALELARRFDANIPFILVSGSVGEEVAVDAMKSGAHDYVMKHNLTRLIPAIERELREAENRRAHQRAEETIRHLAFHDHLTGLVNRAKFERLLTEAVNSAARGKHHALLYLDLDQFKIVNDTCGHLAGDELLRRIARKLQQKVRSSDVLARLGGDEFAILLQDCPTERAIQLAEGLIESLNAYRFLWGESGIFRVGVSIGVVPIHIGDNPRILLSLADMACYAAKDRGGNRVHVYNEEDRDILQRRGEMYWLQRLQAAMSNGGLVLYYQRIVPLQGGVAHCELLLRMRDGEKSVINPDCFILPAERYNLMPEIDRWVIGQACEQLRRLQNLPRSVRSEGGCFINLSANSLSDPNLVEYIRQQLVRHGIAPGSIGFEITETATVADFEEALQLIETLRRLGCKVALDDFGTGMSSFSYLRSLPVDYIKIDGKFVSSMLDNEIDTAIVEAVNSISHLAGIQTIAECVESEAVLRRLAAMKVDYAQGWAIARAHPVNSLFTASPS